MEWKETFKWLWRITKENFSHKALSPIDIQFEMKNDLKIMTFNIRRDNLEDKENNWQYRRDAIVEMIADTKPDIICMQEVMPHMAKYLKAKLSKYYDCKGLEGFTGKEVTKSFCVLGEGLLTFYRKDRFILQNKEKIKLFDGRKINLRRAWVTRLYDIFTHRRFNVVNTHFCHLSDDARIWSFSKLNQWYLSQTPRYETFLCGDFNCHGVSIIGFYRNTYDRDGTVNFFKGPSQRTIDFIYSTRQIYDSRVIREPYGGREFLSDHWPVLNTYRL